MVARPAEIAKDGSTSCWIAATAPWRLCHDQLHIPRCRVVFLFFWALGCCAGRRGRVGRCCWPRLSRHSSRSRSPWLLVRRCGGAVALWLLLLIWLLGKGDNGWRIGSRFWSKEKSLVLVLGEEKNGDGKKKKKKKNGSFVISGWLDMGWVKNHNNNTNSC